MLEDEVDAIRRQLKLLGHSVPTDVIVNFLKENNELFSLEAAALDPHRLARTRSSEQPSDVACDNVHAPFNGPTLPSNESQCSRSSASQTGPSPQLDITWAGKEPSGVPAAAHQFVSRCLDGVSAASTAGSC